MPMRDLALKKRALIRSIKKIGVDCIGAVGSGLPFGWKLWAAQKSSKLGVLLKNDRAFIFDGYLGKYRLELSGRSGTDRALLSAQYEPEVLEVIRQTVKKGWHCVDAGANVGAITLALCDRVGPQGKVFSFEPGPLYFERLQNNLFLNPSLQQNVVLERTGLSEREETLFWEEDPLFPGNAFLFGKKGIEVPVTTLDLYFATHKTPIHFIKIDVEGMELEVLRGGKQLIEENRPAILFETLMDFEAFRGAPIRKMAQDFLSSFGYRFYRILPHGRLEETQYPHFGANTLAKV